jgi:hypothetical protein
MAVSRLKDIPSKVIKVLDVWIKNQRIT